MLRAVVLLLILPPLLVPPGMCVCRFVPNGNMSVPLSAHSGRPPSAPHTANPRPDCTCDACRARTTPDRPQSGDDHSNRHPTDGPSGPGRHWPGCPAADGVVSFSTALPTAAVQADLVTTAAFSTPAAETVPTPARHVPVPSPAITPPLFISHCTLLI